MSHVRTLVYGALALLVASSVAIPLADAQPGPGGSRRGPPAEAFEACADKAEGDACSFSGRRGDVEGSCIVPPNGKDSLVCAPSDRGIGPEQEKGSD